MSESIKRIKRGHKVKNILPESTSSNAFKVRCRNEHVARGLCVLTVIVLRFISLLSGAPSLSGDAGLSCTFGGVLRAAQVLEHME
jgi:hypothetical protein